MGFLVACSCWRFLLVATLVLLSTRSLPAAGGTVVTLPQPGTKIKSGLAMTIDLRGIDANGYRPVAVTIKPLNNLPLAADRQVRVVLSPYAYMSSLSPEASQVIELPEGSTTVTDTIAIPQSGQWMSFRSKRSKTAKSCATCRSTGSDFPRMRRTWRLVRSTSITVTSHDCR